MSKKALTETIITDGKHITTRPNGKRRVQTINHTPTRTQQQFRDEVNVNSIMKKYNSTRQITHLNQRKGVYADISTAQDYFDSMNTIQKGNEAFAQLPSHIRKKFDNDPGKLLEFIHNPNNYDEAVKLGIFDGKLTFNGEPVPSAKPSSPAPNPNDDLNDEPTPSPAPSKKTKHS